MKLLDGYIKSMSKDIKKYDNSGNVIYYEDCFSGFKEWHKYDEDNRMIYHKYSTGLLYKREFKEEWWEYDKYGNLINITEDKLKELEYLSRKKVSRFELIEI